jgi:hypothetical protein
VFEIHEKKKKGRNKSGPMVIVISKSSKKTFKWNLEVMQSAITMKNKLS